MNRKQLTLGSALLLLTAACGGDGGSAREPMTPASAVAERRSEAQDLLDRAAGALASMRADDDFRGIDAYLSRAQGVMIFPRLRKAGLFIGGEGGDGVLLTRTETGWSSPAFYRLRSGSAGLQIGYEESTVVLALMTRSAVEDALGGGFTLGAQASVATGTIGDAAAKASTRPGADVVQFIDAGGVFLGASLSGAVIGAHDARNADWYGAGATPRAIVQERLRPARVHSLQSALPPPS